MQQKENSSVASGAQAHNRRGLSWEDKYVCLQQENQKLKQRFGYHVRALEAEAHAS
jgi:hypothetical protein